MGSLFETLMLVCFGLSWPINMMKAYKARTAKGTSLPFLLLIITIMNLFALVFEPWYEGWGTEDAWESGDYFDGILEAANVDTIVGTIRIVLWVVTIVCAVACIIIYLLSLYKCLLGAKHTAS